MQSNAPPRAHIRTRILDRLASIGRDCTSPARLAALNVFFELSLEYDTLRDFKSLCVLIPDLCLDTPASLYMRSPAGELRLRRTTSARALKSFALSEPPCPDSQGIIRQDGHSFVGICDLNDESRVIGLLCLHRPTAPEEDAFWLDFTRLAAHIMAAKQIALANRKRLTFINNLFQDIGHNVIVPNIRFKLLFLQMERQIAFIGRRVDELAPPRNDDPDRTARMELPGLVRELLAQQQSISKRFQQSSLFLESLLRRSHIEKGAYDLQLRPCRFKSQIFEPQIERFLAMLREQDIRIEIDPDVRIDEDITLLSDLGLMSQVFANLLANAVKYTRPMPLSCGGQGKLLRFGWSTLPHGLGPGRPGVRLFVATSGPEIGPAEQARLFDEGFRSDSSAGDDGSGHGLFFVKQIVELHNGRVGYVYEPPMNVFHLVLPLPEDAALTTETGTCPSPS